jgi:hypothetical protein
MIQVIAMLRFRWYTVSCPACEAEIDILPPQSIAAETRGLTHRCPSCRRWLTTFIRQLGSARHPEIRAIESQVEADDFLFLRQELMG